MFVFSVIISFFSKEANFIYYFAQKWVSLMELAILNLSACRHQRREKGTKYKWIWSSLLLENNGPFLM